MLQTGRLINIGTRLTDRAFGGSVSPSLFPQVVELPDSLFQDAQ
jgi:hypothetical protein